MSAAGRSYRIYVLMVYACLVSSPLNATIMIRKNSLFCKLIRIKTSSKFIFDSYMAVFQLELETCPVCGSCGNCHVQKFPVPDPFYVLMVRIYKNRFHFIIL